MNTTRYRVVYSLGIRCNTDYILKTLKLKQFSSIFGNLYIKSFANIIHTITTGFTELFDQKNLVHTWNMEEMHHNTRKFGHRTLHRLFDDIDDFHSATFPHHDLSRQDMVDHFTRGLRRLNSIKKHEIPILFVNISHCTEFNNLENTDTIVQALLDTNHTSFHVVFIYVVNSDVDEIIPIESDAYKSVYKVNCTNHAYRFCNNQMVTAVDTILKSKFQLDDLMTMQEVDALE